MQNRPVRGGRIIPECAPACLGGQRGIRRAIAASQNGMDVGGRIAGKVNGAVAEFTLTTDIPAATRLLSLRNDMDNGATAAAVAYDFSGVYVATDF